MPESISATQGFLVQHRGKTTFDVICKTPYREYRASSNTTALSIEAYISTQCTRLLGINIILKLVHFCALSRSTCQYNESTQTTYIHTSESIQLNSCFGCERPSSLGYKNFEIARNNTLSALSIDRRTTRTLLISSKIRVVRASVEGSEASPDFNAGTVTRFVGGNAHVWLSIIMRDKIIFINEQAKTTKTLNDEECMIS